MQITAGTSWQNHLKACTGNIRSLTKTVKMKIMRELVLAYCELSGKTMAMVWERGCTSGLRSGATITLFFNFLFSSFSTSPPNQSFSFFSSYFFFFFNFSSRSLFFFLAVQNSSIGDLVTDWLTNSLTNRTLLIDIQKAILLTLSLIHIWRCRRIERCRSRWSPYH